MDYCLNEYSLHGQFLDAESFCDSLINNTLPVFNRIRTEAGNVIWNRDILVDRYITDELRFIDIRSTFSKRNKQDSRIRMLNTELYKFITNQKSVWNLVDSAEYDIVEYKFDEEQRTEFDNNSCFYMALVLDKTLVSFESDRYSENELKLIVESISSNEVISEEVLLTNIFCVDCLDNALGIKWRWYIEEINCMLEIRPREHDNHQPHFHAKIGDDSYVFSIEDCNPLTEIKKQGNATVIDAITQWHHNNKDELVDTWKRLHG